MKFLITDTGELIDSVLMRRCDGKDDEDCLLAFLQHFYGFDSKPDENEFYHVSQWEWEDICDDVMEEIELFGFKSNMCSFVSYLTTPYQKQHYYETSGVSYEFMPHV